MQSWIEKINGNNKATNTYSITRHVGGLPVPEIIHVCNHSRLILRVGNGIAHQHEFGFLA